MKLKKSPGCSIEVPSGTDEWPARGDRIARDLNDRVIHRLFGAGLALQSAHQMMGGHPAERKLQEVIAELDLVIRDIRDVLFDHGGPPQSASSESPD